MTRCRHCGTPILRLASLRDRGGWVDFGGSLRCTPDGPWHEPEDRSEGPR